MFAPCTTLGPGSEAEARRLVEEASMQQFRYDVKFTNGAARLLLILDVNGRALVADLLPV